MAVFVSHGRFLAFLVWFAGSGHIDLELRPRIVLTAATQGVQLPDDINQDASVNLTDAVNVFLYLFTGSPRIPCNDESDRDPSNIALVDFNGNNEVNLSDGVAILSFLFVMGTPHVLGVECVAITGCPENPNYP